MGGLPRGALALALALLAAGGAGAIVEQRGRAAAAARAQKLRGLGYIVVYSDDATPPQVAQARAALSVDAADGLRVAASLGVPAPGAEAAAAAADEPSARTSGALLRLDVVGAEGAAAAAREGSADEARVLSRLQRLPGVAYAVRDGIATVQDASLLLRTEANPPWGLDRIDQRGLPLDDNFTYPTVAGAGVTVYVVDTGVSADHSEFDGRASRGWTVPALLRKEGADDLNGHGTHCAGVVAGATVGVAKAARVVGVKVLNKKGTGSWSAVLQGIDWAVSNCTAAGAGAMCVLSMSLGGPINRAVDDAVARAAKVGVVPAVAAGNSNADACKMSPARAPAALTVGATTDTDLRAWFSNYGPCVKVYAPGMSVLSAWSVALCPKATPTCYRTMSGTSMATPHVAGVAALVWSQLGGGVAGSEVVTRMLAAATPGVLKGGKVDNSTLLAFNRV